MEGQLKGMAKEGSGPDELDKDFLKRVKEYGFSDIQLAKIFDSSEQRIREMRKSNGVEPVYKSVDTCAAEFEAYTPYYYSTYEQENEVRASNRKKVVILGCSG